MDTDPLYDLLYEKCRKDPDLLATVLTVIPTTFNSWFTGDLPDGSSTVLYCFPYTGRYPEIFSHVLRLACPQTERGCVTSLTVTPH